MAKPPVNDFNTEQALLWTFLVDPEIIEKFFEVGQVEWFYNSDNRKIASKVFEMRLEDKEVDIVSLSSELPDSITQTYLIELTELASSWSWQTYSNKLEDLYKRRELRKQANALLNASENWENIERVVEDCFSSITSVLSEWKTKTIDIEEWISSTLEYIEENKNSKTDLIGWSWWNDWLDYRTRWIKRWKTVRIWAPSWVGKTNFIYQTIVSLINQGAKVLFVSLENSIETTLINLSATLDRQNSIGVEKWDKSFNKDWFNDNKHLFHLTDQLFDIDEIKREVLKVKPDVVFLDYIGLVNIKGCDEKTLYDKYADTVKQFVQKNKWLSWIDLSNLNKDDWEERIRMHKGFNGSAKLRNNTDISLHFFYYQPFYKWKDDILKSEALEEEKEKLRTKNCLTFFLSKQRGWVDWVEEHFTIDYNNWYNYSVINPQLKAKIETSEILS